MAQRRRGQPEPGRADAVLDHLLTLLNTRQGMSRLDPEYGMPDITDITHNMPRGSPVLSRMIVAAIQRYEPRLKHVVVRPSALLGNTLSLTFEVTAQLVSESPVRADTRSEMRSLDAIAHEPRHGETLHFQTTVSAGGQVSIG